MSKQRRIYDLVYVGGFSRQNSEVTKMLHIARGQSCMPNQRRIQDLVYVSQDEHHFSASTYNLFNYYFLLRSSHKSKSNGSVEPTEPFLNTSRS